MTAAKPRHRVKRTELLALLGVVGVAASAGAIVTRRFRSGARGAPETPGTSETTGTLIGHEFGFMGHIFHIIESARDTEGGSLRMDYSAPPGANISEHTHHFQEESFEVLSGKLGLRVGGRESILAAGQVAIGPPKVPHAWWNPSDETEVRFVAGIRPGFEVEGIFETLLGLMREGKTVGPFLRNPLQAAVMAREIASWVVLGPVEKALLAPVFALAFAGGLLGYRARYQSTEVPGARANRKKR